MRISDWSSDVCSSDLIGNDACEHAGETSRYLSQGTGLSRPPKGFQHVVADPEAPGGNEARHALRRVDPEGLGGRQAVAADQPGGAEPGEAVDQPGLQQGRRHMAADRKSVV